MESFLQKEILGNTIESYGIVLITIFVALLAKRVISKYVASLIYKLIARAKIHVDKKDFLNLVIQPMELFLLLLISFVALDKLDFPSVLNFKVYKNKIFFVDVLQCIANATLVIAFIWLLLRIIDFIAMILEEKANINNDKSNNQLILFFKDFFKVILVLVGLILVIHFAFNRNVGNLLTGLSIVGAAIALATKESLENLIASFIIFFDKPFVTGDTVKVYNFTGTVERIGLRSTRIRTDVKTYITVPNKQMVDSILDNVSLRTQRKVEQRLELSLSTTPQQIKEFTSFLQEWLQQQESVQSQSVFFLETGKNAHVIAADYLTMMPQSIEDFNQLRECVNLYTIDLLTKLKIEFAAANTDINVHNVN